MITTSIHTPAPGLILSALFLLGATMSFSQSGDSPCSGSSHDVIRPFLGEWEEYTVTDSGEVYIGRLSTHLDVNECVLRQRFVTPDSSFSYLSHGFVNPSGLWEETYVFNSGGYSKYLWIADGEDLYTLRIAGSRKTDYIHRLKYSDVAEDAYLVVQQESVDGGRTWISRDSTMIRRID